MAVANVAFDDPGEPVRSQSPMMILVRQLTRASHDLSI